MSTIELIATVLAESEGDGTPFLLLLGPAGGAGVYFGIWRYYRNTHQSHSYESEARVAAQPITGTDQKVHEVKGTKRKRIDGDNKTNHRHRVKRLP